MAVEAVAIGGAPSERMPSSFLVRGDDVSGNKLCGTCSISTAEGASAGHWWPLEHREGAMLTCFSVWEGGTIHNYAAEGRRDKGQGDTRKEQQHRTPKEQTEIMSIACRAAAPIANDRAPSFTKHLNDENGSTQLYE